MRILLTSPLMSYQDRWGQYHCGAGDTFPAGIGSIGGYLEVKGWDVEILEPDIEGLDEMSFRHRLEQGAYGIVGVSAFTPNVHFAMRTVQVIRQALPNTHIVMGGAHPTLFPEQTLQESKDLDYVITHEGEIPMLRLAESLVSGEDLKDVPNLYRRQGEEIVANTTRCDWLDLDELPLFPFHKFDMTNYEPAPSLRRVLPTFNYMAQRGCPFACSFCDTRTHGRKVRYRSVQKVLSDLEELKVRYGVKGIIFEGSNFTVNHHWVESLCKGMIERHLDLSWYCMGRVDVRQELLPLMHKAGMWAMSFGIESANEGTLAKMHKAFTPDTVRQTLSTLRRLGVRSIGSFILGYPGEDEAMVRRTIDYSCELPLDVAVFFIPVPFPGTKLREDAKRDGGLREDLEWQDYSAWLDHNKPIYINPLLGEKHVQLYNYAFRRFYIRPSFVGRQLAGIRSWQDLGRLLQGFRSVAGVVGKYVKQVLNGWPRRGPGVPRQV